MLGRLQKLRDENQRLQNTAVKSANKAIPNKIIIDESKPQDIMFNPDYEKVESELNHRKRQIALTRDKIANNDLRIGNIENSLGHSAHLEGITPNQYIHSKLSQNNIKNLSRK